jgi:hypothetical protein
MGHTTTNGDEDICDIELVKMIKEKPNKLQEIKNKIKSVEPSLEHAYLPKKDYEYLINQLEKYTTPGTHIIQDDNDSYRVTVTKIEDR